MKNLKLSTIYVLLACFFAACTTEQPKPKTVFEVLTTGMWQISTAKLNGNLIGAGSPNIALRPNNIRFRTDNTYTIIFQNGQENGTFVIKNDFGFPNFDLDMTASTNAKYTFTVRETMTENSLVLGLKAGVNVLELKFRK